jgi:Serine phosphatase RsbU, regulator of sigma subunit
MVDGRILWRRDLGRFGLGGGAAAMTALARHTVRVAALHEATPSRVLRVLNSEILQHRPPDMFCTAAYAHAVPSDDGGIDVTMALGGHPPGVIVRHGWRPRSGWRLGTLLGVREDVTLTDAVSTWLPTMCWCSARMASSSAVRAGGCSVRKGSPRCLPVSAREPPPRASRAVERAVMEFASGAPEDDVAIVVVRPTGDGAGLC